MIRHTVVFKLKYPAGSPDEQLFLAEAAKLSGISGVHNFETLRQVSAKNDFEYGLSMEFETLEAYQAYNHHPEHKYFVETYWMAAVEKFLEIDYEPLNKCV